MSIYKQENKPCREDTQRTTEIVSYFCFLNIITLCLGQSLWQSIKLMLTRDLCEIPELSLALQQTEQLTPYSHERTQTTVAKSDSTKIHSKLSSTLEPTHPLVLVVCSSFYMMACLTVLKCSCRLSNTGSIKFGLLILVIYR